MNGLCFSLYFQVLHMAHNTWPTSVYLQHQRCSFGSNVNILADDIALYCSIQTMVDSIKSQKDINSIFSCIAQSHLEFKTCKKQVDVYLKKGTNFTTLSYLDQTVLTQVSEHKYLGVMLTCEFLWSTLITNSCNKSHKLVWFLHLDT